MPPVDNNYKLRNQEFLQEYAQRPGVKIMFNGVMYREISKGSGPKPSPKSCVTVHYVGNKTSVIQNIVNCGWSWIYKEKIKYYRCYECRKDFEITSHNNYVKEKRKGKNNGSRWGRTS